jgi:peptidyl-prolyl cis-trans isomerase D
MLKKFRAHARNIGSKILMGLLILTFGVWGIEDMLLKSNGSATVATVGDMKISASEYQKAVTRETDKLRQMLGSQATPDILQSFNMGPQVLQRLVDERLLMIESRKLGLRASDEDVANNIRKNPQLLDEKGKFSKKNFEYFLQANNISEKAFIEKVRSDLAVTLLVDAITSTSNVPKNAASTLLSAREELRNIDLYTIPSSLVNTQPNPTDAQLKEYYDANIATFTAPEYRTISYVLITPDDAKKLVKDSESSVAAQDLETAYHERIEEFKKPERRKVEQLLFATEDRAQHALEDIRSGKSFEQVAKESPILNPKTISLGLIEKSSIIAEAADKVFEQEVGVAGAPVKSSFGWHIFRVKEIIPPMTLPLEEVRPLLEKDLQQQNDEKLMSELSNRIEDSIAGGSTLAEAASDLGLKIITLPPVDKSGKLASGVVEKSLPQDGKFLETAFKIEEKTESPLINGKSGMNYILRVDSVTPERALPLAEIKPKVSALWVAQEKKKQLAKIAQNIAAEFADPAKRQAAGKGLEAPTSLTVSQKPEGHKNIPQAMLREIFSRQVGQSTASYPQDDGHYLLAVVKQAMPVFHDAKDPKYAGILSSTEREYKTAVENEILGQYLRSLAMKYPPSINMQELQIKSDE